MVLVGHQKQRQFLQVLSGREVIPQSYLFFGPRSVGKKTIAFEFALRLIGEEDLALKTHPDICLVSPEREVDAHDKVKRKKMGIEQVRSIILFLSRYPTLGKRRVAILDEAEELTPEAENALLKILEEPNATSVIILVTHQPGKLLPTTFSRLVPVAFDLVGEEELRSYFSQSGQTPIPDFFFSLGMPGLIARALGQPEDFQEHQDLLRSLFRVSSLTLRERLHLADTLAQNEALLPDLLVEWLMGLHAKIIQSRESSHQQRLLILFDRLQNEFGPLLKRQGNTKLLLEKLLLPL